MVQEYAKKDKRIIYYRQDKNIGITLNGHFVWGKATGKYFILGSDDDWWSPDFVSALVGLLLKERGAVCAFCDFEEVDIRGEKIVSMSRYAKSRRLFGMKVHSYPDHYPLLKKFSDRDVVSRLSNFILQKEYDGKANVHRSLCDRQVFLDSVKKLYALGLAECWAFDQLLAFTILTRGQLALSDKILFKCTVGNQKYYADPRSRLAYLDGYIKVIHSCLGREAARKLKEAVNFRYLDRSVGFLQEYLAILKTYVVKTLLTNDEASLDRLKKIRNLVSVGNHNKAALLAKEFSGLIGGPAQPLLPDADHGLFVCGFWPKLVHSMEIFRVVRAASKASYTYA
jgi:hypothetical protein